jgi:hypothetical protein
MLWDVWFFFPKSIEEVQAIWLHNATVSKI